MPVGAAGTGRTQPELPPCPWWEECPILSQELSRWEGRSGTRAAPPLNSSHPWKSQSLWKDTAALSLLQCSHEGLTGLSTSGGSQASDVPMAGDTGCPSPDWAPPAQGERGKMRMPNLQQPHSSHPFPQLGPSTDRSAGPSQSQPCSGMQEQQDNGPGLPGHCP